MILSSTNAGARQRRCAAPGRSLQRIYRQCLLNSVGHGKGEERGLSAPHIAVSSCSGRPRRALPCGNMTRQKAASEGKVVAYRL